MMMWMDSNVDQSDCCDGEMSGIFIYLFLFYFVVPVSYFIYYLISHLFVVVYFNNNKLILILLLLLFQCFTSFVSWCILY